MVLQTSLGTIAHEFQHLINASRRLYVVETTHWNEETWLNEALSHVAEEVMFYRASGLAPRQNIGLDQIQPSGRASTAFGTYMDQNIRRYQRYLEDARGPVAVRRRGGRRERPGHARRGVGVPALRGGPPDGRRRIRSCGATWWRAA